MGSLLSRVTSTAAALPSRVFLYAREKWGKSSLFAHAPGAIFFMTRGETGLTELIAGNRVPPTNHFPYDETDPPSWSTLRQAVKELIAEGHPHKALVIDTCNGAEILCQEHVRRNLFNNSHQKFSSYGKGWEACRIEWLALLQDLDTLRAKRKMSVVLLAHTKVKKFDDPTQDEGYDKYAPACQDKLWDLTHKWADIICFGHFEAETYETDSGKVKARAELRRVLCFDSSPMWEAGNRYGIGGKLNVGNGAKAGFAAFAKAVSTAKASAQPAPATPVQTSAPPPAAQPTAEEPEPDTGDYDGEPEPPEGDAPKVGGDMVKRLIELMHALEVNWAQIRDSDLASKGAAIAEACGLKCDPDMKINQLTAAESLKLKAELEARVAEKRARAEKRAAKKDGAP